MMLVQYRHHYVVQFGECPTTRDALPARDPRTADEIAVASGLPPPQVLGPLSMLEIAGLVVCQGGRWKLALR